jgi:hypothetical protein
MNAIHNFINIPDQKADMENIDRLIQITNIGIEAITRIYDDHRLDKNVSTKLFFLQENLIYRIFAAFHQYELLIAGLTDKSVIDLNVYPFSGPLEAHPTIYRYNNELSSIVDSLFFHLCSVFDYLGHFISYMFEQNKDRTLDWDSLAKKARDYYKDKLRSSAGIREVDNDIRIKLEKYRSQLIHRKRDSRYIGITKKEQSNTLDLIFSAMPETMKHFKNIIQGYHSESKYTLDCLPSAVFYRTLRSINYLMDFLRADMINGSTFEENVKNPKGNEPHYFVHPVSKKILPRSEVIWTDYRQQLGKFYQDFNHRGNGI